MDRLAEANKTKEHLDRLYTAGSSKMTLKYLALAVEYLSILATDVQNILKEMERDKK